MYLFQIMILSLSFDPDYVCICMTSVRNLEIRVFVRRSAFIWYEYVARDATLILIQLIKPHKSAAHIFLVA